MLPGFYAGGPVGAVVENRGQDASLRRFDVSHLAVSSRQHGDVQSARLEGNYCPIFFDRAVRARGGHQLVPLIPLSLSSFLLALIPSN